MIREHRWSGWPGAFCLNCFEPDPTEVCIATHDVLDYKCSACGEYWPQGPCLMTRGEHVVETTKCIEHGETECKYAER